MKRPLSLIGLVISSVIVALSVIRCGGSSFEMSFGGDQPPDDRIYPTVTTLPATSILPHSAVLQGAVNPNGVETTTYFLWGGDPTLLDSIDASGVSGSGTSTINFSNNISQLSSDTEYYFTVGAYTVEYATASGLVLNFRTPYAVEPYWARTYGGTDDEYVDMISLTLDGGYLVTGGTKSSITGSHDGDLYDDLWVFRLNSDGKFVWQKQYQDLSYLVYGGAGYQLADGGFIVATNYFHNIDDARSSAPLIIRLGADGGIIWQKIFDTGYIKTAIDAGGDSILVAGSYPDSAERHNYWLIKLNSSGQVLWQKSYGSVQINERITSIVRTQNGYMMAGNVDYTNKPWLVVIDELGDVLWQKHYTCSDYFVDFPIKGIAYDLSEGYTLVGGQSEFLAARVGLDGSLRWVKNYGPGEGYAIIGSGESDYVIGGTIQRTLYEMTNGLIKIDRSGNVIWSKVYGTSISAVSSINQDLSGNIVFASKYMKEYDVDYDILVAKLPSDGSLSPLSSGITLTPEDMECSFLEDTYIRAVTTSSIASSAEEAGLNTFATVLQLAP